MEEIRALAARKMHEGTALAAVNLLMAAFQLPERVPGIGLPQAIAMVTRNPARATGLTDRGEIAPGKRADLVWVRRGGEVPVVHQIWRGGGRVA